MEGVRLSQYFEGHSKHCPLLQAFNGLQFPPSRKNLSRILLLIVLIFFVHNFYQIPDWVKDLTQGQVQGEYRLI